MCDCAVQCGTSSDLGQCQINCEQGSSSFCNGPTAVACVVDALCTDDCAALAACNFILRSAARLARPTVWGCYVRRVAGRILVVAPALLGTLVAGCDVPPECPEGFGPPEKLVCTPSDATTAEVQTRIVTGLFGYVALSDVRHEDDTCILMPSTLVPGFAFEFVQIDPVTQEAIASFPIASDDEGRWEIALEPGYRYALGGTPEVDLFDVKGNFDVLAPDEVRFVLVLRVTHC